MKRVTCGTTAVMASATARMVGASACPRARAAPSSPLLRRVIDPDRLSMFVWARRSAVPPLSSIFWMNWGKLPSAAASSTAFMPARASCPNILTRCSAVSSAAARSPNSSGIGRRLPAAVVVWIPNSLRRIAASRVGSSRRARPPRIAVPARVACTPLSPMMAIAAAVSSKDTPAACARGAAKDIARPICATLVLALVAAAASTSATRPVSSAEMRKGVIMFVAMSAAWPSSRAPAEARLSRCGRASMLSEALRPAMPRNPRASAASVAVKRVV